MTYTPAPWKVVNDMRFDDCYRGDGIEYIAGYNIESEAGEIVGLEGIIPGGNAEANARLIAAAPDLLSALERSAEIMQWLNDNCPDCFGWSGPYPSKTSAIGEEARIARTAIAKATGA